MVKIYQNIPLEGVKHQNENRENSKFWNEGKWNNFVAPFLAPPFVTGDFSDWTFVDMGCNAGLFLKFAEDAGFRHVVGVEKDRTPVREGLRYRDEIGYKYVIHKMTVGYDFDIDVIPVADVTVMSTFHYYIDINTWVKYLDRLRNKTHFVIIVSRDSVRRDHWRALSRVEDVRGYFNGWEEMGFIDVISSDDDPSPRDLWSMMFRNPLLSKIRIDDIVMPASDRMQKAVDDLALKLTTTGFEKIEELEYHKAWVDRKKDKWTPGKIDNFVIDKIRIMTSVKKNGLYDPIILQRDNKLSDGGHRLAMLKALGYKTVLVRRVGEYERHS